MEAEAGVESAARHLSYFKITKRGRVRKTVREVYLRDDIPCGFRECCLCGDPAKAAGSLRAEDRVLVPDAALLLAFIDFVETDPCMRNCLILSTVLNQVRAKNLQVYGRLRALCGEGASPGDSPKCFCLFPNEFFSQTFVQPTDEETLKEYEARGLCVAAQWLQCHAAALAAATQPPQEAADLAVGGGGPRVTVLTHDPSLKARAEALGLDVQTVMEYLESVKDEFPNSGEQLAQLDVEDAGGAEGSASKAFYEAHWSEQRIAESLKRGDILQGKLRMLSDCNWRGLVFAAGEEVRIVGRTNLNRAFEGDVVAVEIISDNPISAADPRPEVPQAPPVEEGGAGLSAELKEVNEEADLFADDGGEGEVETVKDPETNKPSCSSLREGRVVAIIRRGRREFCGTLRPIDEVKALSMPSSASVERIFVPADRRNPNVVIKTRQSRELDGKRLVVAVDSWDRYHRLPRGHWTEILGSFGDRKAEGDLILREQGITQREFSQAAMRCLPPPDWTPSLLSPSEKARRLDLRSVLTCSIDPPNCKDIDDALSLERLSNGRLRVGVHIADVTHFLRPDTQLDIEAAERCTTVYLVERRTDMLPALLTTDLCSLVYVEALNGDGGGRERLAFSVLWEMDADANILQTCFHKTIIKSSAALTYQEAQSLIDDKRDKSPLAENLRELLRLSQIFRRRRMEAGGLQLASPDVQVIRQAIAEHANEELSEAEGASGAEGHSRDGAGKDLSVETVEQEAIDIALYQARETNKMVRCLALRPCRVPGTGSSITAAQTPDSGSTNLLLGCMRALCQVEDYMLLANVSVAKHIEKFFPQNSLLRRHPSPKTPSLETLKKLLEAKGVTDFECATSRLTSARLHCINPSETIMANQPL
ncbi:RNB family domain-containing protein [Cyclospora cayetanensis]|uniref:RNB family domain-containing protein n=1 Tax=Cyclospora cayetanensis TaxID=88456 RepID=A0A1D3CVE6_9EIME|nr:RNB family domain-containing protein [Cyclospora cayetanensis]